MDFVTVLLGSAESAFMWSFGTHVSCVVVACLLSRYRVLVIVASLSGRGGHRVCPIGINVDSIASRGDSNYGPACT